MSGLLELYELRRTYGPVTALDDLTFSVPSGQVVGFLGPNGAGKTTTMRAIFGLTDLESGSVTWNGAAVGAAERRRFGYMPEERGSTPACRWVSRSSTSAGCTVSLGPTRGRHGHVARAPGHRRPGSGQGRDPLARQPAAGAARGGTPAQPRAPRPGRAAGGPRPGGHRRHQCGARRPSASGCCVLFSSHQLDLVEDLCDVVTIIDHGRLVVSGTVDELVTSGSQRLVVRVEGDRDAAWAQALPGVTVSEVAAGAGAARARRRRGQRPGPPRRHGRGRVTEFSFGRRRLSEVFRESLQ